MDRNRKTAKGLASALGLALIAMLAFGVFAAGAQAQSWHVNGKAFAGEASFESQGSFEMHIPSWGMNLVNCGERGEGSIYGGDQVNIKKTIYGCEITDDEGNVNPTCVVQPIVMNLEGSAGEALHSPSILTTMYFEDSEEFGPCSLEPAYEIADPKEGFSLDLGSEGLDLSVTSSAVGEFVVADLYFSGSSAWQLADEKTKGAQLGFW